MKHNEKLHNLYAWPNILRWAGHAARVGKMRCLHNILVDKPEEKRLFGRPGRRWLYSIRMDVTKIRWEGVDWMNLVQDKDQW